MSASDKKNLDILLAANADVLTDQDAEYLRQLDVSDVEISAETDKRITRMIKRKSWLEAMHTPILICKRIAAVFLIVCTIGFAICMSVQEVRAYMMNMILQWNEKFVSVTFVPDETPPTTIEKFREPAIQPAGTVKQTILQDPSCHFILYMADEIRVISYQQYTIGTPESHKTDIDSENCIVEHIKINGFDAQLFVYDDGNYTIVWHDNEYSYILTADSIQISKELFILMAESVYTDVGQTD